MNKEILLSICIPTYNRASTLKQAIDRLLSQINDIDDQVELLVSNNCSSDNTEQVILDFIAQGAPITYNCNEHNLGMDGNFVYCFNNARGKYVWLLSDDDYLIDGALAKILDILRNGNYGLVHLRTRDDVQNPITISDDKTAFLNEISIWLTFISANIVRTKYVAQIDFNKYMGSYFTLIPVYLTAAIGEAQNVMVRFATLDYAKDAISTGGYNIFEVFAINYLRIIKEFRPNFGRIWYEKEKFRLCRNFIWSWLCRLCLQRDHNLRFQTNNWRYLIFSRYWYEPYFYFMVIAFGFKRRH